MTKATKRKLESLTSTVNLLTDEQAKKQKTIMFLAIGIVAVIVVVFFVVFMRKRRR